MSRLKADLFLLAAAIIWGGAFVAQKGAMDSVGPFTFTALRFFLSALLIAPLALRETGRAATSFSPREYRWLWGLGIVFFVAVVVQQIAMQTTTVTNAGFLTSLYVIFTPLVSLLLFRIKPGGIVWLAAPLCIAGIWLLGDGSIDRLNSGDFLALACAVFFAVHITMIGFILRFFPRPFTLMVWQNTICAVASLIGALALETILLESVMQVIPEILYAGLISGGIAYSLQAIGQQHTEASDAAIILASEALFAALFGFWLMGDRLSLMAWGGCALIIAAILLVELYPLLRARNKAVPP